MYIDMYIYIYVYIYIYIYIYIYTYTHLIIGRYHSCVMYYITNGCYSGVPSHIQMGDIFVS